MQKQLKNSTDSLWKELKIGIEQIYADKRQNFPIDQKMTMYNKVTIYCTTNTQQQQTLPQSYKEFDGTEFYAKLKHFLEGYVKKLRSNEPKLSEDNILRHYINQWMDYRYSSQILDGICSYLNRHWISLVRENGNKSVHKIYNLCIVLWRKHYLHFFYKTINNRIIGVIRSERKGGRIDVKLLSDVLMSYIEIDGYDKDLQSYNIDNQNPLNESSVMQLSLPLIDDDMFIVFKDSYDEIENNEDEDNERDEKFYKIFEGKFLKETEQYYSKASDKYLRNNSFIKYLIVVEKINFEEERNVQLFLDEKTLQPLMEVLDKVLVLNHENTFIKAFDKLLKDDRREDFSRLYSITQRIPRIVKKLEKIFAEQTKTEGLAAIVRCRETVNENPSLFVIAIMTVHSKHELMIKNQFYNNRRFMEAMDKSCAKFINDNCLTASREDKEVSAQLLARHSDKVMTQRTVTQQELNADINQIMLILRYIEDKDAFVKMYIICCAKRLVSRKSYGNELEDKMIDNLKSVCDHEYIGKLQHMQTDVVNSKKYRAEFLRYLVDTEHRNLDINFDILVLHSGSWPFDQVYTAKLPPEFDSSITTFVKYYSKQHNARLLQWLCTLSHGQLLSHCFDKKYRLLATVFEMCVLLQYNYGIVFTVKQLVDRTEIDRKMLIPLINLLIEQNILYIKSKASDKKDNLNDDEMVWLNTKFKSNNLIVNINYPVKIAENEQEIRSEGNTEEEKKYLLQCAIVRIMKNKKKMIFKQLCTEVFVILKPRNIQTSMEAIKDNCNILVDKDYLQIAKNTKDTYEYVPD